MSDNREKHAIHTRIHVCIYVCVYLYAHTGIVVTVQTVQNLDKTHLEFLSMS